MKNKPKSIKRLLSALWRLLWRESCRNGNKAAGPGAHAMAAWEYDRTLGAPGCATADVVACPAADFSVNRPVGSTAGVRAEFFAAFSAKPRAEI